MNTKEARQLLIRYNAGECTEMEKIAIESSLLEYNEAEIDISDERIEEIGKQVYAELPHHKKASKNVKLWYILSAIASVMLLTVLTWNFFDKTDYKTIKGTIRDVAPGSNMATLTLTNGRRIELNNVKTGVIVSDGIISYNDGTAIKKIESQNELLTITTPRGGQYQIVLPDGTKAWLNAESSLTYPASFSNRKYRIVKTTGEIYFEVTHIKTQPFKVKTATQTIEVLGTHFNINSYKDHGSTITTLQQGSIKVSNLYSKSVILTPAKQSITTANEIIVRDADLETDLAWKNDKIEFKNADIQSIMKEVTRWYNIEVRYQGEIPQRKFNGSISRKSNLSVLLKILQYSNINFKIEGGANATRRLIVTP